MPAQKRGRFSDMDGHPFLYFRSAPNLTCPYMGLEIITFSSTVFIGNYGCDKSGIWEEKLLLVVAGSLCRGIIVLSRRTMLNIY